MRNFAVILALVLSACAAPSTPTEDERGAADAQPTSIAAPAVPESKAAEPASAPPARSVPLQFQGEWNQVPEHCGSALNDSRLRIGADEIQYYESRGPIRAAVARGHEELALIVELSGEGETWLTTEHVRLSADGNELTTVGGVGEPLVRRRCATTAE